MGYDVDDVEASDSSEELLRAAIGERRTSRTVCVSGLDVEV
jgi:hypothetical protein